MFTRHKYHLNFLSTMRINMCLCCDWHGLRSMSHVAAEMVIQFSNQQIHLTLCVRNKMTTPMSTKLMTRMSYSTMQWHAPSKHVLFIIQKWFACDALFIVGAPHCFYSIYSHCSVFRDKIISCQLIFTFIIFYSRSDIEKSKTTPYFY